MDSLRTKTLIMLVGPSAIGKSTVIDATSQSHPEFSAVKSFTTRPKRIDETSNYTFIDTDTAQRFREDGSAITYFEHPTTQYIYGTTNESYSTAYNLLDTLSGSVEAYRNLPFQRTVTISLVTDANTWRQWFLMRYPERTDEATRRLQEARLSLEWSLNERDTFWVVNTPNNLNAPVAQIISIALTGKRSENIPDEPYDMLNIIDKGMWS